MQTHIPTNITVRVQAKGGMFLGPDSHNGAIITIKDYHTQKVLATGFTNGGSGTRSDSYVPGATNSPITTPTKPAPTVYWVVASAQTAHFSATLNLSKPVLLEISAEIPLPLEQGSQFVTSTQWITPGSDLTAGSGFVLIAPGLWVRPEISTNQYTARIRAKVTMMCGCEINYFSPWLPQDYEVSGTVTNADPSAEPFRQPIHFRFVENSQYTSEMELPGAGRYKVEVQAIQSRKGNIGYAVREFTIES